MNADARWRWLQPWRRAADPPWVGLLVAGLAVLLPILAIFTDPGWYETPAHRPWVNLALCVYGLIMLLATGGQRLPLPLFFGLTYLPIAWAALGGRDTIIPMLAMLVVWWMTYTGSRRVGLIALGGALLSILPPFVTARGSLDNFLSWSISLLLVWASVYAFVLQRRTLAELRAAQADLARQAAAEERRRLAREVHDVVAHSLAITLLHVTGARRMVMRDPQRAVEALAQAETLGRQSMADLRRTIGLLSSEGINGIVPPAPIAADIPALVQSFVAAGLVVHEEICGDLTQLPAGLGLDLYRLTQEALTNVAKHGASGVTFLRLVVEEDFITLEISNPLPTQLSNHGAGRGLLGMRERVVSYEGRFEAGPVDGRWRVWAALPLVPQTEKNR